MSKVELVWLIDDDEINNFLGSTIIKKSGLCDNVITFQEAQDGLDKFGELLNGDKGQLPDLIFLDVNMPIMDGWDFLEEFDKFPSDYGKEISLYMLSSSVFERDIEKAEQFPMVKEFISKPLTIEIIQSIRDQMD